MGRPGTVYAITVRHPVTNRVVRNGYVGKTRQRVDNRIAQHRRDQPWAGDIISYRVLWSSRRCVGLRLWWEEVWRIVIMLPLHNYEWNRHNPRRVPVYVSRRRAAQR